MNKKLFIPIVLCTVIIIAAISTCIGGGSKIKIEWEENANISPTADSTELKVYVENSGSMDAYMCSGSNLKDAVFDYVSDINKHVTSTSLYYINSQIISYKGNLETFIKDLTPQSFAKAGGNRANTDLRKIFSDIMAQHTPNSISILVSDCILDIPQSATDFFGNCQVHIKNVFNTALAKQPNLGVEIIQLESKFDGFWFGGKNNKKLSDVKRPYYIWVIGDQHLLANLNSKVKIDSIIGGIKNYCAYASSQKIPFTFERSQFNINHTNKNNVEVIVNLRPSLQSELVLSNIGNYKSSNPSQTSVISVQKIQVTNSPYSHVIELEITNPETINEENVTFSYPYLASWVETSNDSTGTIDNNMDKTTGILYLVKGVAEAYKSHLEYGTITFNLKNK